MGSKPFHGLEIVEIGLLGLTALGLMVAIASGSWLWAAIALWLTLALNVFNRLRTARLTRQQIRALKHQQRQLLDDKLNLHFPEPVSSATAPSTTASGREIQALQQTVTRLEQSQAQVWQVLQWNASDLRPVLQEVAVKRQAQSSSVAQVMPQPSRPTPISRPDLPSPETPLALDAIATWQLDRLLAEHRGRVSALSLSGDGRYLASGSWDQTLKVWDLKTGHCVKTINAHDQGIQAIAFAGDRKIATGSYDQNLKIWRLEERDSGEIVLHLDVTLTAHQGSVQALAAAPDGKLLISGSYDQTIKRWDVNKEELLVSSYDPSGAIAAVALDPQQQWIASAGGDGSITLWQLTDNAKIMILGGNVSSVASLAVSADGQTLAAGCGDGTVKLWTIPDRSALPSEKQLPVRTLAAHMGPVTCLCFSPEAPLLYSAGVDGVIKLWHPVQPDAIASLNFPSSESSRRHGFFALTLTADEQTLIAGRDNGTIQIWTKALKMFGKYQSIRTRPPNPPILGDFETGFPPKLGGQGSFSGILLENDAKPYSKKVETFPSRSKTKRMVWSSF